jgi:hypothetical protein
LRLRVAVSRIVSRGDVFKRERPNRRHLRDVFTGLGPVEVSGIAGQNDDAAGRIRSENIFARLVWSNGTVLCVHDGCLVLACHANLLI